MTDPIDIDNVGDAWVNSASNRTGQNYGSANRVQVQASTRWGYLLPELPNIAGRTVVDAYLRGRAGEALSAQTLTVAPITERWSPGRITYTNRPAINSAADFTQSVSATAEGGVVTIDDPGLVTIIQAVANGTKWYGLRIATDAATSQGFVATDSGDPAWELHVELSDVAEIPENLRPDGGGDQGSLSPILAWEPIDDQTELRVQVDTPTGGADPDEVTPDYDSTMVPGVDSQFDLTGNHTLSGAGPHYWRVQVETSSSTATPVWSDWAEFGYRVAPGFVLDSPTGPFGDVQPTIIGHMTGETMTWWKFRITGPTRADVRYETGLRTGDMEQTIPYRNKQGKRVLVEGRDYELHVQAGGEYDRAVAVGQPGYFSQWYSLEISQDGAATAPDSLNVVQYAPGDPRLQWQWTRSEAADDWLIQVDGQTVAIADGDDVAVDAGVYTWVDSGQVSPLRSHKLGVRAIEGELTSPAVTITEHANQVLGFWILPDDPDIDPIVLDGTAVSNFARTDYRATYTNQEGEEIDIFYGKPPRAGSFEGSVDSSQDDVWETLERIEELRRSRNRDAQLVWGSQSIRARVRDIDATSADEILPTNLMHVVRFNFVQLDD